MPIEPFQEPSFILNVRLLYLFFLFQVFFFINLPRLQTTGNWFTFFSKFHMLKTRDHSLYGIIISCVRKKVLNSFRRSKHLVLGYCTLLVPSPFARLVPRGLLDLDQYFLKKNKNNDNLPKMRFLYASVSRF